MYKFLIQSDLEAVFECIKNQGFVVDHNELVVLFDAKWRMLYFIIRYFTSADEISFIYSEFLFIFHDNT